VNSWRGASLLAAPWPDLFAFARDNDLWVMLHARPDQAAEVRQLLAQWQDVQIVMHGSELLAAWAGLLNDFPNPHLSIDATALIRSVTGHRVG